MDIRVTPQNYNYGGYRKRRHTLKYKGGRKIPEINNIPLQEGGVIYVYDENDQNDFICPLTLDIMEEPTIAEDGFSYERQHIEDWIQIRIKNKQPIISPKTGEEMGINLVPNITLKNIIQNIRFVREPTSDTNTQTEEKEVDSIDVQTQENIVTEMYKENAEDVANKSLENIIDEYIEEGVRNKVVDRLDEEIEEEATDKALENIFDEYIEEGVNKEADEVLEAKKQKNKQKKKRQEKARKERKRQEEDGQIQNDKTLAEEAVANAMKTQITIREKDLFYGIEWETLMNKLDLTKDGDLPDTLSSKVIADFYIHEAQRLAFKHLLLPGASVDNLEIKYLIDKEAYRFDSFRFKTNGMVDKNSIQTEINQWLQKVMKAQNILLGAGFWKEDLKPYLDAAAANTSLQEAQAVFKEYKMTEKHIRAYRKSFIDKDRETKYWGAKSKLNHKGEEIGLELFTDKMEKNLSLEPKFQGLYLFWLNCINLSAKMSAQQLEEFAKSPFLRITFIQMQELTQALPIDHWSFDMATRGIQVGYIFGATIIAAWVIRLKDFDNDKNQKDKENLKLNKWIIDIISLTTYIEYKIHKPQAGGAKKVQSPQETMDLIYKFTHKYYGGYRNRRHMNKARYTLKNKLSPYKNTRKNYLK